MLVATADRSNQPLFTRWRSPSDWPWTLAYCVGEARRIISYFELPEEQQPPKRIWHSSKKCSAWIKDHSPYNKDGKAAGDGRIWFEDHEVERSK